MINKIESRGNSKVKHVSKLLKDKKYRKDCGEAVFEGEKLLLEQINANAEINLVLINDTHAEALSELIVLLNEKNIECASVLPYIFPDISDVKSPQGIVFTTKIKKYKLNDLTQTQFILLDNINDPGNLGTIIRTTQALGDFGLILSKETVDYTSPKVIRSTMGAILKSKIVVCDLCEAILNLKNRGITVYASSLSEKSKDILNTNFKNSAVVIGNEAKGVGKDVLNLSDAEVKISINEGVESLNASVAAAIFIWQMAN